jgi:hypothetical protein
MISMTHGSMISWVRDIILNIMQNLTQLMLYMISVDIISDFDGLLS